MSIHLKVEAIETYIGQYHILQGVDFAANRGEVTVLLGRNGAGKTTTLRTIMGLNPARTGRIIFEDKEIQSLETYLISKLGVGYVPEDQGIFGGLTVEENIRVAMQQDNDKSRERLEWILNLFPDLKIAWKRKGGNLSGGQKQMLSIARAYVNDNRLLLIDEPSKGLAPVMVEKLMESIMAIKHQTTVVLVEQNFLMASRIGDRYYLIDDGKTVHSGLMKELTENEEIKRKYLGIA